MYIIFGNYGDNTVALMQWADEQKLESVTVFTVDTGWAPPEWQARVSAGEQLARAYGFHVVRQKSNPDFSASVKDRGRFPSVKFQWCAGFLKGLCFIEWAEQADPFCEATVLLPSLRIDSLARGDLPELIEESDYFGGRSVRHPLFMISHAERCERITQTGLAILGHRSLECQPCVHATRAELDQLDIASKIRLDALEADIQQPMFAVKDQPTQREQKGAEENQAGNQAGNKAVNQAEPSDNSHYLAVFDHGCGSRYACGE